MRSLGRTGRARPPSAGGVMARLAVARLVAAGIDPGPLLHRAGITVTQIEDAAPTWLPIPKSSS